MPKWNIYQEWDICDMPTGNIYRCLQFGVNSDVLFRENSDVITIKLNICQEWDICDMPTGNIVWEWWRLFSENGDAITGQKLIKN